MIIMTKGSIASSISTGFDPTTISNLVWWIDADSITGLANGDKMGGSETNWLDKSGFNKHLSNSTSASQPIYETNVLNSLPGVLFNPGGHRLTLTADYNISQPCTIFMVKNQSATDFSSKFLGGDYSGNRFSFGTEQWVNRMNMYVAGANDFVNNSNSSGGLLSTYLISGANSTISNKNTSGTFESITSLVDLELRGTGEPDNGPNGYLHEVLIYERNLHQDERDQVETYLRGKWGAGI